MMLISGYHTVLILMENPRRCETTVFPIGNLEVRAILIYFLVKREAFPVVEWVLRTRDVSLHVYHFFSGSVVIL